MRALATVARSGLLLSTRTGASATERFPELASAELGSLPPGSVVDGEIVVLDDAGLPSFSRLAPRIQQRGGTTSPPAVLVVFDLLVLGSTTLLQRSYDERRALLEEVLPGSSRLVLGESYADGDALLAVTAETGLEGVVAKRRSSAYRPGVRSRDWVKVPHRTSHSYLVGGWKSRRDSPSRLASLLVGTPTAGGLAYAGAVGSGLGGQTAGALSEVLAELETPTSPFVSGTSPDAGADLLRWAEPLLVVDVEHLGRSAHGLLRQPALLRVRPDLSPVDLVEEVPR